MPDGHQSGCGVPGVMNKLISKHQASGIKYQVRE
jgi:hypothetical protein